MFDDKQKNDNFGNMGNQAGKPGVMPPPSLPTENGAEDILDGADPMVLNQMSATPTLNPLAQNQPAMTSGQAESPAMFRGAAVPQLDNLAEAQPVSSVGPDLNKPQSLPSQPLPGSDANQVSAGYPPVSAGEIEGKNLSAGKKVLIVFISILLLGGLGIGGYWLYQKVVKSSQNIENTPAIITPTLTPEIPETEGQTNEGAVDATQEQNVEEQEAEIDEGLTPAVTIDADGDGLTDDEERALGTDINKADTDDDQLPDRDEVEVYKTDPLNKDSDGDGYMDGEEVKAGYDPKGPGRLPGQPG